MITWSQFSDNLLLVSMPPCVTSLQTLHMALLYDIEQVSHFSFSYYIVTFVKPLNLQSVKQRCLLILVQVPKQINLVKEAQFCQSSSLDWARHNRLEDSSIKYPDHDIWECPDSCCPFFIVEERDLTEAFPLVYLFTLNYIWFLLNDDLAVSLFKDEVLAPCLPLDHDVLTSLEFLLIHGINNGLLGLWGDAAHEETIFYRFPELFQIFFTLWIFWRCKRLLLLRRQIENYLCKKREMSAGLFGYLLRFCLRYSWLGS